MFIISIILVLMVAFFVLENRGPVTVEFLNWGYTTTLGIALVVAALVGAVIMYFAGTLKQRELRGRMRAAEARARELERQQRDAASATARELTEPPM